MTGDDVTFHDVLKWVTGQTPSDRIDNNAFFVHFMRAYAVSGRALFSSADHGV